MDIKAALNKARGARKVAPRGKALIEVSSIDEKAKTITGKILDGTGRGEEVTFTPGGHLDITDYTQKKRTKVDIPGGLLRVEGLDKKPGDATYVSRWCKTFQSKVEDGQKVATNQVFRLVPTGTKDRHGVDRVNINVLDLDGETFAHDMAAFTQAITKAYDEKGAFTIMGASESGEPFEYTYYRKGNTDTDGKYVLNPVSDEVEAFFEKMGAEGKEVLAQIIGSSGLSVIPTQSIPIGSETWRGVQDKIEEAKAAGKDPRGGPVDPADFAVAGLGPRFSAAVARLESEGERDAVQKRFLAFCGDDMKVAFGEGGFANISDADMRKFFEAEGVTVLNTQKSGYAVGSILTKPYDDKDPNSRHMVTKTFGIYAPTPFPNVEALKDVRDAYYKEMERAVATILEAGPTGPAKKAETTPAAQAQVIPADLPADAGVSDASMGDIDDILGEIDGMEEGAQV